VLIKFVAADAVERGASFTCSFGIRKG